MMCILPGRTVPISPMRLPGPSEIEVLDKIMSIVRGYKKTLEKKYRRIPQVKVISIREEDHALPRKIA